MTPRTSLKWMTLAACFVLGPAWSAIAKDRVDTALILAADISFSVGPYELDLQRRGYVSAFRDPDVIGAMLSGRHGRTAITYLEWAGPGTQVVLIPWTIIDSATAANALADQLREAPLQRSGETAISSALDQAIAQFQTAPFAERWVIDLSSDGYNNAGPPVEEARARALYQGITINGLPIVNDSAPDLVAYFQQCVTGGYGAFTMEVNDPRDFAETLKRKMVHEIAFLGAQLYRAKSVQNIGCDIGERLSDEEYDKQIDDLTREHPDSWRWQREP